MVPRDFCDLRLTMLEIHRNVVAADIRRHGNDGRVVKLSDEVSCGNAVQVWHDDIHEDKVVLRACVQLVHSFKPIQCAIDMALEGVEEFAADAPTGLIIFHQENLRLSDPAGIHRRALLATLGLLQDRFGTLWRFDIWNVVDVAAVHWVNALSVANWVYHVVKIAVGNRCRRSCGLWRRASAGRPRPVDWRRSGVRGIHAHVMFVELFELIAVEHVVGVDFAQKLRCMLQR